MLKNKFIIILILNFVFVITISSQIQVPVIENITVDITTQEVNVSWKVNNPALIDGYIIKRQIFGQSEVVEGTFNTVATINDRNITTYIDNGTDFGTANPKSKSETYKISAFTNPGPSFGNMSEQASTVYLSPIIFDLCNETNTLTWTSHNDFANFGGYRIYYKNQLADAPTLLTTINTKEDTTYIHKSVNSNIDYHYYIQAFNSDNSIHSNSNIEEITTTMPPAPSVINADYASVETYQQVNLSFTVDANAVVNSYVLLESNSLEGPFDTLQIYQQGIATINYVDNIKSSIKRKYYKVLSINTCNIASRESNIASNILLEATVNSANKTNTLNWNNYQTWYGGIDNYQIYRSIDGATFEMLAQVGGNETTYSDNISDLVQPQYGSAASKGHFCYYIYASEGSSNPYGITGKSKSNISCAHQETILHIPTAFNPNSGNSKNREFKPVISFVNDYNLMIYDRWGGLIYKSNDPLQGWNGTLNGTICKKGTYIYYLRYRSENNELIKKSGQINLIY